MIMSVHEAAEVLRHPEDHWSREKDDAVIVAKQLLVAVDDAYTWFSAPKTVEEVVQTIKEGLCV